MPLFWQKFKPVGHKKALVGVVLVDDCVVALMVVSRILISQELLPELMLFIIKHWPLLLQTVWTVGWHIVWVLPKAKQSIT